MLDTAARYTTLPREMQQESRSGTGSLENIRIAPVTSPPNCPAMLTIRVNACPHRFTPIRSAERMPTMSGIGRLSGDASMLEDNSEVQRLHGNRHSEVRGANRADASRVRSRTVRDKETRGYTVSANTTKESDEVRESANRSETDMISRHESKTCSSHLPTFGSAKRTLESPAAPGTFGVSGAVPT